MVGRRRRPSGTSIEAVGEVLDNWVKRRPLYTVLKSGIVLDHDMREPFGDVLQRQAVAESSFLLEKIGICVQLDSGVQKLTAPPPLL